MSANPIDKNTTPKTTGSLEDLFRHHLGEEAAAPPRPMLWDQIDNSLLIRQNETYRRRLAATRWVAAASLLLATLAGTGWWAGHEAELASPTVATNSAPVSTGAGAASRTTFGSSQPTGALATTSTTRGSVARQSAATTATAEGETTAPVANNAYARRRSVSHSVAPATAVASASSRYPSTNPALTSADQPTSQQGASYTAVPAAGQPTGAPVTEQAITTTGAAATGYAARTTAPITPQAADAAELNGQTTAVSTASTAIAANATVSELTPAASGVATVAPEQVRLLAARPAALDLNDPTALPNGLALLALPEQAPLVNADNHRWHYGASYTASVFNPNIDFSRAGLTGEHAYKNSPALGANSSALTEEAAAQYRDNLRLGFSQRVALLASRHLNAHWSLRTGAEFTQATAQSATASSFVGEQLPDVGQSNSGPLHTTDFRYRMASIPLELRYDNPTKRSWSLYGRLGGVVSALLGVRSEVAGDPEATRTYSMASGNTPYRRVLGNLRGGAGAQYRASTGAWALSLGPVAEVGLVSLNAHPVQSYLSQSRAYSFGLEAAVEFGR